jgi:N6-adenosine-specific RNA methylase IME4
MRYHAVVIDPPWHYEDYATMPGSPQKRGHTVKRPSPPYESMSLDQIGALPIWALADADSFVFLWATNHYLPDAMRILVDEWSCGYRQTLVWHKTGNPSPFGGTLAPNHAEFLLVGAYGLPKITGRWPASVVAAPKPYRHSQKPEVFLDLVESVSPGPYLELFARRNRLGWDTWGNESLEHVKL